MQNRRETGSRYEKLAAAFLEEQGFAILKRNYRCRSGEIDLIARDGNYLVFVEVKYRSTDGNGTALEAIDRKKAERIRRVAAFYLYENRCPENTPCRFDAVGIDGMRITHIKNIF